MLTTAQASPLRTGLDWLYGGTAALAAVSLAGICVLMLVQIAGREMGVQVRGADDITAWLCAASAFLPLAHTFRHGELIRVGLLLERLAPATRRYTEVAALLVAAAFVGYMSWWLINMVLDSWRFNDQAQGMLVIPLWIPQVPLAFGSVVLLIAMLDELVLVLCNRLPTYTVAEQERRASGDFSETV